jgi:hypothetical protein
MSSSRSARLRTPRYFVSTQAPYTPLRPLGSLVFTNTTPRYRIVDRDLIASEAIYRVPSSMGAVFRPGLYLPRERL